MTPVPATPAEPVNAAVRAAGGVVWRSGPTGVELIVVHRPRFDDWSLPKGKLKRGEHALLAAVREVEEETGVHPGAGARLPAARYQVWVADALVDKVVEYWAMTPIADGGFRPGREVDGRRWLPTDEALDALTYKHDEAVVRGFLNLGPPMLAPVVLIRHAAAGERAAWTRPDEQRPLTPDGVKRAAELAAVLAGFAPERLVSAPPRRCRQTLAPLEATLAREVEIDPIFEETADPADAARHIKSMAGQAPTVVCSQGRLIPGLLEALTGRPASAYRTAQGSGWVLTFNDQGLAALDELP